MPSLESDKVRGALRRKLGCVEDEQRDHVVYWIIDPSTGKKLRYTKVSHGPKHSISSTLVAQMARQFALTTTQFCDFVGCSFGGDKVIEIVRAADMTAD